MQQKNCAATSEPPFLELPGFASCIGAGLRLDRSLIDQHDGDVVLYRVDPVALLTFETFRVLTVLERLFAGWTNQHFQEVLGNHDPGIVRQGQGGMCGAHRGR